MKREHVLAEIKRTAGENGGVPLGRARFQVATGIKESDWSGRYWRNWGEAVREAGFAPHGLNVAIPDTVIFESLARLAKTLQRFPTRADLQLEHRNNPAFPSANVFARFGTKAAVEERLRAYCRDNPQFADVASLLGAAVPETPTEEVLASEMGFVYLLKAGRFYKLGRTNSLDRRSRELAIQLPQRPVFVHAIKTDDPVGIEAYWHRRFGDRRANGEWFALGAADVAAFRRRRFM